MKIIIYTNYLISEYVIDFKGTKEELAQALHDGPVLLNVYDENQKRVTGTILVNSFNAVLIEIDDTPLS